MKIENLRDLLEHEIQDIYSAETQITKALPKLIKKAQTEELRRALQSHLKETEMQLTRLERAAKQLGIATKGPKCKGMEGILQEGGESLSDVEEPAVIDAAIIKSCQHVEHYEIASYGTAKAFAEGLEESEVVQLLDESLAEEKAADEKLTEVAVGGVNQMAEDAGAEDRDESEEPSNGRGSPKGTRVSGSSRRGSAARR